ncbi:MAG: hypothetical protein Q7K44_02795 [Candidatus Liptonbacteria bacterium]|nr:hypothetical protein [Candidatus Liptonbacteria bacterium]
MNRDELEKLTTESLRVARKAVDQVFGGIFQDVSARVAQVLLFKALEHTSATAIHNALLKKIND